MKIYGNFKIVKKILFLFCLLVLASCKINSDIARHNYFNHDYFYNDSIKVSIDFLGAMKQREAGSLKKSEIKNISKAVSVPSNNLFIACNPDSGGFNMYFFYKKGQSTKDTLTHERFLFEDQNKGMAAYEKQKGQKKVFCVVKTFNSSNNPIERAKQFIKKTSIDSLVTTKFSYTSIINNYSINDNNILQARKKIKTSPVNKTRKNGLKNSFLRTLNSFMSNNIEYDTMIVNYERKNKEKHSKLIKRLYENNGLIKGNDVFKEINDLAKSNQIIIINEDHYYPKHRLFAMQILDILKQNGYKYISLEAFAEDIYKKEIPNKNNGFYINEPYFAHFIRKANELGFVISGHENHDDKQEREIGQAKNILKILEKDPNAKIFIYVGQSHLEKENKKKKWMAAHLKELSKINPITINQASIFADTKESLLLFSRKDVGNDSLIKSSSDYFLINNLNADLKNVYPEKKFKNFELENIKFKNKEVLIDVYDWEEHAKNKTSIPIVSILSRSKKERRTVELPVGKYFITVKSEENERIVFNEILVE